MGTDEQATTGEQPATTSDQQIEHRRSDRRFVFSRDGVDLAHLEYVVRDGVWFITHTFTEPAARGQGLAAQVTRAALDGARADGVRVRPVCPYVVEYMSAHPEYADLHVTSQHA